MSSVVVVGQGYVGLPMALRASEVGHHVVGLELNESTVEALNAGHSHIDDIPDEVLQAGLTAGFQASSDPACIAQADTVVVCVPTPLAVDGGPDLAAVEGAARTIGNHVKPGALVILESTTYPGTTEEIFAPLVCGDHLTPDDVMIAFSPERINPGDQVYGVKNTPKVVGGLTKAATDSAVAFYSSFIDTVIPAKGAKEAEMAKLLENTFRHVNIALVNEMLRFSHELDIDLWNAIDCAETKPFGFMAFRPGPGVGGHCIPVDPSYLSHRVRAKLGYAFRMVELAEEINHAAPLYVGHRAWELLNAKRIPINGANIVLLGVTYKANISDQRESPAVPLAEHLIKLGAKVSYIDPHVDRWAVRNPSGQKQLIPKHNALSEALQTADLAILLQEHDAFSDLAEPLGCLLLDTRGTHEDSATVARL